MNTLSNEKALSVLTPTDFPISELLLQSPFFENEQDGSLQVLIPAGKFQMGSKASAAEVARMFNGKESHHVGEHPRHEVVISRPFYMGVHEVTQAQFSAVMGIEPWKDRVAPRYWRRETWPAPRRRVPCCRSRSPRSKCDRSWHSRDTLFLSKRSKARPLQWRWPTF